MIHQLMIHQLEIGRTGYGGLGIIVCPEWHNPALFIPWTGENISPRPEQRYPQQTPCLHAACEQITTRINFRVAFQQVSALI